MNLSNICIVLTNPDESRNIGSACRALANMGIKNLRIVGRKENYDDKKVRLIPFVFSSSQNYVIEAGEYYFRFFHDGQKNPFSLLIWDFGI